MLMSDPVVEESVVFRFVKHLLLMERDENQSFAIIQLRPEQSDSETYSLPDTLSAIERLDASQAKKTRTFVLDPGSRTINKKQMNPDRIDEVVHAGDIEIWTVKNHSGTYHPFHIHGVQFQIVDVDGKPPQDFERGWKDTILVPNGKDMSLIMKFPMYADAHVQYMYHCHILEHEDMGMMGQFVVLPIVPEENLFK
jgi:bilirubin oxidase